MICKRIFTWSFLEHLQRIICMHYSWESSLYLIDERKYQNKIFELFYGWVGNCGLKPVHPEDGNKSFNCSSGSPKDLDSPPSIRQTKIFLPGSVNAVPLGLVSEPQGSVTRLSTSGLIHIFDQLIDEVLSTAIAVFSIPIMRAIRTKQMKPYLLKILTESYCSRYLEHSLS